MQGSAEQAAARPRPVVVRAAVVAVASLGGGLLLALWRGALADAATSAPPQWVSVALFGALCAFAILTWRRLAALGRATDNAVVYDHGVRRFGLGVGGSMAVWQTLQPRWPLHVAGAADLAALAFLLVVNVLMSVPIAMWGGYLWGRLMGAVFHVPKPPGGRRPDV